MFLTMLHHQSRANTARVFITVATLAASAILASRIVNTFCPDGIQRYFSSNLHNLSFHFSSQTFIIIIEEHAEGYHNQMFQAVKAYLRAIETQSVLAESQSDEKKKLAITLDKDDQEIVDLFKNVQVRWRLVVTKAELFGEENTTVLDDKRSYELTFEKKHKDTILNSYLPYILEQEKFTGEAEQVQKLSKSDDTFDNVVMDLEHKKAVIDDLNTFMNAKEKYRRIGKAWIRRYLINGPPGSGKSRLIAAMANHLNYDIYELDWTHLRSYFISSFVQGLPGKSVLVINNTESSTKRQKQGSRCRKYQAVRGGRRRGRNHGVAVSDDRRRYIKDMPILDILNVTNGLWSCSGNECIIIFKTDKKENVDPNLLRPAHLDMYIDMCYGSNSTSIN